jgi:DNA-binding transcriptional LysR family regulator
MDLRQLSYFRSVARHGSISAAAAELGVAQPTLTKSIRALEQELDAVLFNRLPRGVEMTPFGASFLTHVEAVQVQIQDARREIESLRRGTIGSVTIGAGPAWLRRHLPEAVATSIGRHPELRVAVQSGFDDALLRDLRQGLLDFVVAEVPSPDRARDLDVELLSADVLGVCCRAATRSSARRRCRCAGCSTTPGSCRRMARGPRLGSTRCSLAPTCRRPSRPWRANPSRSCFRCCGNATR